MTQTRSWENQDQLRLPPGAPLHVLDECHGRFKDELRNPGLQVATYKRKREIREVLSRLSRQHYQKLNLPLSMEITNLKRRL